MLPTPLAYARELRLVAKVRSLVERSLKDKRRAVAVLEAARMLVKAR